MLDIAEERAKREFPTKISTEKYMFKEKGFINMNKYFYMSADLKIATHSNAAIKFFQSYENLAIDNYMADGGKYRFRRFGRFEYNTIANILQPLSGTEFFQKKEHNSLNGGVVREFSPLEPHIKDNDFLKSIININLSKVKSIDRRKKWLIFVHQIRIVSGEGAIGKPSPEGIHRDGHDYVSQVLISKNNVKGGISRLYNDKKLKIASILLDAPLDTILIKDGDLYHDVTPITAINNSFPFQRDMLLIDFNG